MKPEKRDKKLVSTGWVIQDKNKLNLYESLGVAVRKIGTDVGHANYMLFIAGKACGIIETKSFHTQYKNRKNVLKCLLANVKKLWLLQLIFYQP